VWSGGATASGVMPKSSRTIAVDTDIIPFGTEVYINGNLYIAEDTGSAIVGNRIDIYMDNHSIAQEFGVQYAEVFIER
jgi:3D (Asp-Asp-Asp) domain-containing protein